MIYGREFSQDTYNPIRAHIQVRFERCADDADRLAKAAGYLRPLRYEHSRAIVFVRTRKGTEAVAQTLEKGIRSNLNEPLFGGKIGHFHAGLSADERDEVYEKFKDGTYLVLVATKAFGMGMDIPNIHYVLHWGPSGTFEDFLQEIGRAGREQEQLLRAGFSEETPIQTVCLFTPQDFGKLRDLTQSNQLSWQEVSDVHRYIAQLHQSWGIKPGDALPLPLDFYARQTGDDEASATNGRLALHWLEQLDRISLGFYLTGYLEFENATLDYPNPPQHEAVQSPLRGRVGIQRSAPVTSVPRDEAVERLVREVIAHREHQLPGAEATPVPLHRLKKAAECRTTPELFRVIARAQKAGALRMLHALRAKRSDKEAIRSMLEYFAEEADLLQRATASTFSWESRQKPVRTHPYIEAVFSLAIELLDALGTQNRMVFDPDWLNERLHQVKETLEKTAAFPWLKAPDSKPAEQQKFKKEREYALKLFLNPGRRKTSMLVRTAFWLLNAQPGIRHKSRIEGRAVVQELINQNYHRDKVREALGRQRVDVYVLLRTVALGVRQEPFSLPVANLLNLLSEPDLAYAERLISLGSRLNLFQLRGSSVPMALECFLKSEAPIEPVGKDTPEANVLERFRQSQQLRLLRLYVLNGFSTLDQSQHAAYIDAYFRCKNAEDILGVLEEFLGSEHPFLGEFREEAYTREEDKLDAEQRTVYDAPLPQNLNVVAGPGSGKTHTLILRVARLVHREHIKPDEILVLAYNRAVVVELKARLRNLFRKLGYNRLSERIPIYTFHGFMRKCLGSELEGVEFTEYPKRFLVLHRQNPGLIAARTGPVRYAFVDEFQDITTTRLDVLKTIVQPSQQFITVIGDPNQSIYGFDRRKEGDPTGPESYYQQFDAHYQPQRHYMRRNYRSFPAILQQADAFLKRNPSTFEMPELLPERQPGPNWPTGYAEQLPSGKDWPEKVQALLTEKTPQGKPYGQIAVMFRTNDELFRAFEKLNGTLPAGIRLRIQGDGARFTRIREVYFLIENFLKPRLVEPLGTTFLEDFQTFRQQQNFPAAWDVGLVDTFEACLKEYQNGRTEESIYEDLLEFIRELTDQDDGQLAKIYQKNAPNPGTEVILTTIHRVKGLEFDAVLVMPSYAELPFRCDSDDETVQRESIEEERRLWYVALTRARYRLVVYTWQREDNLLSGSELWKLPESQEEKMGKAVRLEWDKFFISYLAMQDDSRYQLVHNRLKIGQPVELMAVPTGWRVMCSGTSVAFINKGAKLKFDAAKGNVTGLVVTAISVHTHEETLRYDQEHSKSFAEKWLPLARERGYTYLVDFAGYGQQKG